MELDNCPWCKVGAERVDRCRRETDWLCGSFKHGIHPTQSLNCKNNLLKDEIVRLKKRIVKLKNKLGVKNHRTFRGKKKWV